MNSAEIRTKKHLLVSKANIATLHHANVFLAAALAACSSSQYHVHLVLVVPELLSEFEFFGFLRVPYVNMRLLRVNSGYIGKLRVTMGKLRVY